MWAVSAFTRTDQCSDAALVCGDLLEAAALRARQRLRTPDAIQIATGLRTGATLAVTNDAGWRNFPLIETVILSDLID
jgi:predicted nucleic acid-binding protein